MAFSLQKSIGNFLMALVLLCGGMALLVLIYMWLAWYVSLRASRRGSGNESNHSSSKGGHGLSKSDIRKLPTVVCNTHHPEKHEDEKKSSDELCINGDLDCSVCLEQFKDGDECLLMPTCRHCFHVACASAWLSKSPICPLCRTTALPKDDEQYGDGGHIPYGGGQISD
ncbi:hypothetical protein KI387_002355, partial [Taxus chinensis]